MVVQRATAARVRRTSIWAATSLRKGEHRRPGVPAVLPALEDASPGNRADRMDLARWLVDRRNPLTARVIVNRIWQVYFGRGLVETENDFGTQGSAPSHPELLDWLASEFMDRGWSQKAIHRLIVSSATYRQSSRFRPDWQTIDPDNRLLAAVPAPSGRRADPRRGPDGSGLLDAGARRPERLPAPARRRHEPRPDGARGGRDRAGSLSPRHVHLLLAGHAAPAVDSLRRARRHADLHPPESLQHAVTGADAAQRPGVRRDRRGLAARILTERPTQPRDRDRIRHAFMRLPGPAAARRELEHTRDRAGKDA